MTPNLNEEFDAQIDDINDEITTLAERTTIRNTSDLVDALYEVNAVLEKNNLTLDYNHIEDFKANAKKPSELDDGVNIVFPLYDSNNEESDFNLSMTYAVDDEDENGQIFFVEFEVQYFWEVDSDLEDEYEEF